MMHNTTGRQVRRATSILLSGALIFTIGGCAGEQSKGDPGKPAASSSLTAPDEASLTPKDGGVLRIGVSSGGLAADNNPNNAFADADFTRAAALYDKLTDYDDKGEIEYALAESMEPNKAATQWRINLRQGVHFQDGSEFTAKDVLYTWRKILAGQWKTSNLLEVIDLEKTSTPDPLTIDVVLKRPVGTFPEFLAAEGMFIVKDGFDDYKSANGTGAFDLVRWTPTDRAVLKRKDNYWRGKSHLDGLEVIELTDVKSAANALRSGQIDVLPRVSSEDIPALKDDKSVYLAVQPGTIGPSFYMRSDKKPFDDPNVREAMKYAIDRQQCLDVASAGIGEVGNDLPGPASEYYATTLPQRKYDPEKAKQLLKKSGLTKVSVTLTVGASNPAMAPCAQVFQQSAKKAGIDIKIQTIPASDVYNRDAGYLQRTFGQTEYNGLPIEIFVPGFLFDGARNNDTHYADAAFEKKYWEAVGAPDAAERKVLLGEIQKDIWENKGFIIWGLTGIVFAFSADVHGAAGVLGANPTLNLIKRMDALWLSR